MIFKEFGSKNNPHIVLLHGGGLSTWSLRPLISALKKDYYVIAPVIDGHGEDWENDFISIEKSSAQVIDYINNFCGKKVYAICGLSIGAQIAVDILSKKFDIAKFAVIESALVCPLKFMSMSAVPLYGLFYGLIKKRWFARYQAKMLNVPEELFEEYYNDSIKIKKSSLINIAKSNADYSLPLSISETKAKVLILAGERELAIIKKSAKLINNAVEGSILIFIKNSGHGDISLNSPDKYVELLQRLFNNCL